MKKRQTLKVFLSVAWKASPAYLCLLLLSALVAGAQTLSLMLLPKYLIDEMTGAQNPEKLLFLCGLIVVANALLFFATKLIERYQKVKAVEIREKIVLLMAEKIMAVPYEYLENPTYLDMKERAVFAVNNQGALENMVSSLAGAVKAATILLSAVAVMLTLSWVLVALLLATVGLSLIVQALFSKYQVKFFNDLIPINRKYGYYINLCMDDKLQKDIRLCDMSKLLSDRVTKYNREINTWFFAFNRRAGLVNGAQAIIGDLQAALAYGYAGLRAVTPAFGDMISIGSLTMYVSAAASFTQNMSALGQNVIAVGQMLSYLEPFMQFMSLPDQSSLGGENTPDEIGEIRFDDVSFSYPGEKKKVLDHVSFTVGAGEKISVVGLNGAGKTTLVKLLCRLFKPDEGRILVNGKDIQSYDLASYLKKVAAVFQDYKLLAYSVEENVTCAPPLGDPRARALIRQVGLEEKIVSLPNGMNTRFGKAYDREGTEFSGGEAQKVAIARALYKNASLVILDEPTSALDPLAEAEIYRQFNSLVGGKTALYISHRMSSSVFCDRILVLDGGRVADFDTHDALMRREDGLYRRLFEAQAKYYRVNEAQAAT